MLPPQIPPGIPPVRVQLAALLADQVAVKLCPAVTLPGLKLILGAGAAVAVSAVIEAGMLGTVRTPVPAGSSTERKVTPPVLLVESAVEVHTAASAVKSATPFEPSGGDIVATGQAP